MSDHPVSRYIFLRHTDTSGHATVQPHLVWNAERFIASQKAAADAVNAKQEPGQPRKARVEQITQEQYSNERKPK